MVFLLFAKIPPPFLPDWRWNLAGKMTSVAIATGLKVYDKPATYSGKPATLPTKRPPIPTPPKKVAGLPPESVAGLLWNQWPVCFGISGRFGPEYAAIFSHSSHVVLFGL